MKYYLFRDLDHQDNLQDGKTYHAAGLVYAIHCELDKPNSSGKDLVVTFLDPFEGYIHHTWRMVSEVELFEIHECEHKSLQDKYSAIDEAKKNY